MNLIFELAKRNLKRNSTRSLLTIIGVVVGVVCVSSLGIYGSSITASISSSFSDLATKVLVLPAYENGYSNISGRDVLAIKSIKGIDYVAEACWITDKINVKEEISAVPVYGLPTDAIGDLYVIEEGYTIKSKNADVCVVGRSLAERYDLKIGQNIELKEKRLKVSGILERAPLGSVLSNVDNSTFISKEKFDSIYGFDNFALIVTTSSINDVNSIQEEIERRINLREKKVNVQVMNELLEGLEQSLQSATIFLIAIGAVSLLVAGVSILNIMLISTIERRREIGTMLAIGGKPTKILKMFFYEAFFIGVLGCAVGAGLSLSIGSLLNYFLFKESGNLFSIQNIFYVCVAIIFGMGTCIISALYPAYKAANMDPVEALKYE